MNFAPTPPNDARVPPPAFVLHFASGWLLLFAAIAAPVAFGCVAPVAVTLLNTCQFLAFALWTAGWILGRRRPRCQPLVLVCGGLFLAQGWFMVWNARAVWLSGAGPIARNAPFPGLPGAMEQVVAGLTMTRLSALLLTIVVVSDLARMPYWRVQFIHGLVIAGALIAAIGLAQTCFGASWFAAQMDPHEGAPFATFNYHGNAGAYLNLTLPLLGALWIEAMASAGETRASSPGASSSSRRVFRRTLLSVTGVLFITAAAANTSRGAQAITAGLMLALFVWGGLYVRRRVRTLARNTKQPPFRAPMPVVLLLFLGAASMGVWTHQEKWRRLPDHLRDVSARRQVWRVAYPMAQSAGPMGHGPGAFKLLLPRSPLLGPAFWRVWITQDHVPGSRGSMWSMAHEDYLQTWIEFGGLGCASVGVIFFGGLVRALRRAGNPGARPPETLPFLWMGITLALSGVALNALFDFPLQVASLQLTCAVLLGLCWSVPLPK